MKTFTLKATKDLIDATGVKCFTKDKEYTFDAYGQVTKKEFLDKVHLINDNGVKHRIGLWYKHFRILKPAK